MAEEEQNQDQGVTTRINGSMFKDYIDQIARVVGKVGPAIEDENNPGFMLETSDGIMVNVILADGAAAPTAEFVEIIGTIVNENTIKEVLLIPFEGKFGLFAYFYISFYTLISFVIHIFF